MHEHEIDTAARIEFRETVGGDDPARVGGLVAETGFFSDEERRIAIELVDERLAKGIDSGYEFIFAERAGELVGYTCHGRIAGTRSSHDLYWIAVHPRVQRRGLGRELIVRSERAIAAAGGTRIYVDTSSRPQYAPTRAFYERAGYTRAALLDDYYAPGDGLVIFQKVLR